jgi:hypothetical protein
MSLKPETTFEIPETDGFLEHFQDNLSVYRDKHSYCPKIQVNRPTKLGCNNPLEAVSFQRNH